MKGSANCASIGPCLYFMCSHLALRDSCRLRADLLTQAPRKIAMLDTALFLALLLSGQPSAALELLKGLNYCDVKICEEFLQKRNQYACLLKLYKCTAMHHEALKLLHQLVEESKSDKQQADITQKFKLEMTIEYLKAKAVPKLILDLMNVEKLTRKNVASQLQGFDSVMVDGSEFPFKENISYTKFISSLAHAKGMIVEAELGRLSRTEDDLTVENYEATMTDIKQYTSAKAKNVSAKNKETFQLEI